MDLMIICFNIGLEIIKEVITLHNLIALINNMHIMAFGKLYLLIWDLF